MLLEAPGLQSTPALAQQAFAYQLEVKQAREAAAKPAQESPTAQAADKQPKDLLLQPMDVTAGKNVAAAAPTSAAARVQSNAAKPQAAQRPQPLNVIQKTFRAEALARLQRAVLADCGITERLVAFWSNHFCISAAKGELARIWAGAFEREAIRPHVLGRFTDMLKAVEQHPAMLFFLDNQQSVGPDSRAGQNRKRGFNENLAREIMELHTLGVTGSYSQDDVTALARIITGWTFVGQQGILGAPGSFAFNANAHQPGPQRLLGRTYPAGGVEQGEAALADLARHPATANFIATKFARHFVADDPPSSLVVRLKDTFKRTDGNLKALTLGYAGLHDKLALSEEGPHAAVLLDSFFALHPSMPEFARMYKEKHAAVIHAVATPYRDRSHFDGQDVLESGFAGPGRVRSGWLNRALGALPQGERVNSALALGPTTPLVLRGPAPTVGWAPLALPQADDDTATRLVELYRHRDPALASALTQGLALDKAVQGEDMKRRPSAGGPARMRLVSRGAAMAADDGPPVAALSFDGWDTHANEGGPVGRLVNMLSGLDGLLAEFESGLGAHWRDTVVVAATEFGRTARINGTEGTDHGTGTIALLAGGAVSGGRVIADWPTLKPASLYEGRDLAPTTDLRAVIKGVLADHLGVGERVLAENVFPDSRAAKPMRGLIA